MLCNIFMFCVYIFSTFKVYHMMSVVGIAVVVESAVFTNRLLDLAQKKDPTDDRIRGQADRYRMLDKREGSGGVTFFGGLPSPVGGPGSGFDFEDNRRSSDTGVMDVNPSSDSLTGTKLFEGDNQLDETSRRKSSGDLFDPWSIAKMPQVLGIKVSQYTMIPSSLFSLFSKLYFTLYIFLCPSSLGLQLHLLRSHRRNPK